MEPEGILLAPGARVLPGDVRIRGVRSGGPGGQNVNKVATAAVLRYVPGRAKGLSEEARGRLIERLGPRLTRSGAVLLKSQSERTFAANREAVLARLVRLLAASLAAERPRKATRPTRASVARRLEAKRRRALRKQSRRGRSWDAG